jgi:hypothetical protein
MTRSGPLKRFILLTPKIPPVLVCTESALDRTSVCSLGVLTRNESRLSVDPAAPVEPTTESVRLSILEWLSSLSILV